MVTSKGHTGRRADKKFEKFNERQHKVLHLRRSNPIHYLRLRAILLESNLSERDLGVLMNSKVGISQQQALVTKGMGGVLVCVRKRIDSSLRERLKDLS